MHEKGLDASTFCKLELPSSVGRGLRHPGLSLSLWATMVRQQTKHRLWDDRVGGEKSGMEGRIIIIDMLDVHLAISPAVPATQLTFSLSFALAPPHMRPPTMPPITSSNYISDLRFPHFLLGILLRPHLTSSFLPLASIPLAIFYGAVRA